MGPVSNDRIRLVKTAFVLYYHQDLLANKQFLLDFGLEVALEGSNEIYFKGYGTEPYVYVSRKAEVSKFGGAAYVVESRRELEKAENIAGATSITPLAGPGGGEKVTLTDPAGHKVHLVHGWTEKPMEPMKLEKLVVNYEDDKPRKGLFQRFKPGPAPVFRWGHYGVTYPPGCYETMFNWYSNTLTLIPSDIVYEGEKATTCFFHIDRGTEFTDHHSFFFKMTKGNDDPNVAHAAFEVHDYDIQQLGHNYLLSNGHKICWGIGRHVLGSQIFDYWFDPSKFILEHYADGDLVNNETPISHVQAGPEALSVWGPPVPSVF
ncbi:Glyoxalase/Bleomycin resistance protein/Dihydroxybiphenyl dioxygenase [Xylogone sp. PMI_703]|nr:Glyoxalase/Bleomycin resistance protein/Dihydroxybiphenyl dioxygenase [Xylogone sp. PMI_703]